MGRRHSRCARQRGQLGELHAQRRHPPMLSRPHSSPTAHPWSPCPPAACHTRRTWHTSSGSAWRTCWASPTAAIERGVAAVRERVNLPSVLPLPRPRHDPSSEAKSVSSWPPHLGVGHVSSRLREVGAVHAHWVPAILLHAPLVAALAQGLAALIGVGGQLGGGGAAEGRGSGSRAR